MTRYAFNSNPPILAPEGQPFVGPDGTGYPSNWIENSTAPGRTARDIYPVVEADEPGEGQYIVSETFELVDGKPTARAVYADLPTPPRRLIPKSVIHERVNDIHKLGDVLTALQSQPIYYARWFSPDWPNVYFDDTAMLQVLAAVGCTSGQIATITAP